MQPIKAAQKQQKETKIIQLLFSVIFNKQGRSELVRGPEQIDSDGATIYPRNLIKTCFKIGIKV